MSVTSSAEKAARVAEKKRLRNKSVRTRVKSSLHSATAAIAQAPGQAVEAIKAAVSSLDRAVTKGVIHRNSAARRKSRLMARLNQASAGSQPAAKKTRKPAAARTAAKKTRRPAKG